ncbi:major facilitator superfamily domain-containing protein 10-like [Physella acuta]|uniref:major facilitator superfamily domain-containing protein 10-like n=1 Tax=Physella acuta TaxID=109671 RepID=UPI0027DE0407|nr:major facilitator superfamily domain-containing protein 10-like [Physella acuta]XP_059175628.1 major facilitator superfamily domain-containing protein 10-like [Physella acuta]XP_059175636.1 major facilitator superfamily domain-containing protein 10-like [Physella acuta]XP_059175644.1 major facilitator superfamily domain-containing protein 10-like [Physella acuta]
MKTRSGKTLDADGQNILKTNSAKIMAGNGSNKIFYTVFVSLILDLLAFTVILPLLPGLLEHYSNNDQTGLFSALKSGVSRFSLFVGAPDTPRWNSVLFGGLIGSLFSMLQFLTSPIIGAVSDVYGRRPMMLLSLFGIALSYLLWALSNNFLMFVIARIVGGISKSNVSLATAIVTDVSTPQQRGKGMALIGIAFSIGFVFGPTIGAAFSILTKDSEASVPSLTPALFSLCLSLIDIVYVYLYLPETLPASKRLSAKSLLSHAAQYISPVALFKFSSVQNLSPSESSKVQKLGRIYFIFLFVYAGLEFTLPFLMHNRFHYSSMQQGKMFFYIGTVMALVQGGYTRRITPGKEAKIASHGIVILIPSFLLMAFATVPWLMYTALTLFAFASATVVPCLTTLVSTYGGDHEKGTIMGIFRSLGALARAIAPILASFVYWGFGAHICYTIGGILLLLPLLQVISLVKGKTQ